MNDTDDVDLPPIWLERFSLPERDREGYAAMAAATPARSRDPEAIYAEWLADADTPERRRYVEDLIARVRRHVRNGTAPRLVELAWTEERERRERDGGRR